MPACCIASRISMVRRPAEFHQSDRQAACDWSTCKMQHSPRMQVCAPALATEACRQPHCWLRLMYSQMLLSGAKRHVQSTFEPELTCLSSSALHHHALLADSQKVVFTSFRLPAVLLFTNISSNLVFCRSFTSRLSLEATLYKTPRCLPLDCM